MRLSIALMEDVARMTFVVLVSWDDTYDGPQKAALYNIVCLTRTLEDDSGDASSRAQEKTDR